MSIRVCQAKTAQNIPVFADRFAPGMAPATALAILLREPEAEPFAAGTMPFKGADFGHPDLR